MKKEQRIMKAFGKNEIGLCDLPTKISGVFISRIHLGEEMGCSHCFTHRHETRNSHYSNRQRSWKKYRNTQWKHDS